MKSCFELSDAETKAESWSAREWFIVRKAEVQICDSSVLIPFIKMGVEAREQIVEGSRLLDKPLSRPDHPMVKYAESFTRNFDLIAERKSVIHHLRELARATVLAKYLSESKVTLEDAWYNLSSGMNLSKITEVPQLWNECTHSMVQLKENGQLKEAGAKSRVH